jgi:hypothetical protein
MHSGSGQLLMRCNQAAGGKRIPSTTEATVAAAVSYGVEVYIVVALKTQLLISYLSISVV